MTNRTTQIIGAAAMLAALLLPDPALGQARRFEAFGESLLEVNNETDPSAELFSDPSDHALLVLSRRLRSAFALTVEDAGLYRIARSGVQVEDEGVTAVVPDSVSPSRVGTYAFVDSVAAFAAEGLSVRIVPKPPLSGEVPISHLLTHSPEYRHRRDRYLPSEEAIHDLASYGEMTEVVVLFAVSSPPCGVWVPRLMKVFQAAGNPVFSIRYLSVDAPDHPALRRFGVNTLPAILLLHGGDELGRIEQAPRATLEEEIVAILKGED
ncbi:thioredoxin family protein [bacterium]|nr:thioredoxin family protein [bacterium]